MSDARETSQPIPAPTQTVKITTCKLDKSRFIDPLILRQIETRPPYEHDLYNDI